MPSGMLHHVVVCSILTEVDIVSEMLTASNHKNYKHKFMQNFRIFNVVVLELPNLQILHGLNLGFVVGYLFIERY